MKTVLLIMLVFTISAASAQDCSKLLSGNLLQNFPSFGQTGNAKAYGTSAPNQFVSQGPVLGIGYGTPFKLGAGLETVPTQDLFTNPNNGRVEVTMVQTLGAGQIMNPVLVEAYKKCLNSEASHLVLNLWNRKPQ